MDETTMGANKTSSKFRVTSGKVHITDPCYGTLGCGSNYDMPAKNGAWEAGTNKIMYGNWGERIESLTAFYMDPKLGASKTCKIKSAWKPLPGRFGLCVDSGQLGIFDSASYETAKSGKSHDSNDNPIDFYDECMHITLSDAKCGSIRDSGYVTTTGVGDGIYDGFGLYNRLGELIGIHVVFIDLAEDAEIERWDAEMEALHLQLLEASAAKLDAPANSSAHKQATIKCRQIQAKIDALIKSLRLDMPDATA